MKNSNTWYETTSGEWINSNYIAWVKMRLPDINKPSEGEGLIALVKTSFNEEESLDKRIVHLTGEISDMPVPEMDWNFSESVFTENLNDSQEEEEVEEEVPSENLTISKRELLFMIVFTLVLLSFGLSVGYLIFSSTK